MTYWHNSPDDQKDIWHWMGVALSLAYTIGLHRNPTVLKMPQEQKSLRKRIWWSLFIRDRIVALSIRRSIRIVEQDCTVPMLEMEDFNLQTLSVCRDCGNRDHIHLGEDVEAQKTLARLCIEEAKLCVIIGHILQGQYSVVCIEHSAPPRAAPNNKTTMVLLPRKSSSAPDCTPTVDAELAEWIERLPEDLIYRAPDANSSGDDSKLLLYKAVLIMLHDTAINMLHRPQSSDSKSANDLFHTGPSSAYSTPSSLSTNTRSAREASLAKTRAAAFNVTRVIAELSLLDLIRYMPTFGVTGVVHAAIVHLVDARSPNDDIRDQSIRGLSQCMQALEQLCDMYIAADYACFLIKEGMHKSNISMPLPVLNINSLASAAKAFPTQHVSVMSPAITVSSHTDPPTNKQSCFDQAADQDLNNGMPNSQFGGVSSSTLLTPNIHLGGASPLPLSPGPAGTALLDRLTHLPGYDYIGLNSTGPFQDVTNDYGLGYGLEWLAETGNAFASPGTRDGAQPDVWANMQ